MLKIWIQLTLFSWLYTLASAAGTRLKFPYRQPISRQSTSSIPLGTTNANLTISTTSGLMTGGINPKTPNVRAFLSIPYAQPPIDDLRWQSPQPLTDDMKVARDVSRYGPSCQQFPDVRQAGFLDIPPEFAVVQKPGGRSMGNLTGSGGEGTFDEDCLTLSVHTPTNITGSLPVLIFITGGALVTGGINIPAQNPAFMVEKSQSHIVVAMNYRVGIFGFPGAAGITNLTENNLGILDQRMAIEWTRDNIAAFGGNASSMVLWGQSAGGFSVEVHDFAFPENPIVSGLIADSGNPFQRWTYPEPNTSNFTFVAKMLCEASEKVRTPLEELTCLRQVPGNDIQKLINKQAPRDRSPPMVFFRPTVDGKVVLSTEEYERRSAMGLGSNIPLIIGSNTDETTIFQPSADLAMNRTIVGASTAEIYTCTASKLAFQRLAGNRSNRGVYVYQYAGNFSNVSPSPYQGAYHGAELPILFGTAGKFRGNGTAGLEEATMDVIQGLWVTFAKGGAPALEDASWPPYKNGTVVVFARDGISMQFDDASKVERDCTPQELGKAVKKMRSGRHR